MKRVNEHRFLPINKKRKDNEYDPNEPFFNGPKGEYLRRKEYNKNLEKQKEDAKSKFNKDFEHFGITYEQMLEIGKKIGIHTFSSHIIPDGDSYNINFNSNNWYSNGINFSLRLFLDEDYIILIYPSDSPYNPQGKRKRKKFNVVETETII